MPGEMVIVCGGSHKQPLDGYVRLAWEAERSGDQSNTGLLEKKGVH